MKIVFWSDIHMSYSDKTYSLAKKLLKKINKYSFEVLLLGGDLCSKDPIEVKILFKLIREVLGYDVKVYWVKGNHEFWSKEGKYCEGIINHNYNNLIKYYEDISEKYQIYLLDQSPVVINKYVFMGFDGWYAYNQSRTKDELYMPEMGFLSNKLRKKAHEDLNNILLDAENKYKDKIKICLTHFPPYSFDKEYEDLIANKEYLKFICESFDYLLLGHSHQDEEWEFKDCKIINPGSDYDNMQAKMIDLSIGSVQTIRCNMIKNHFTINIHEDQIFIFKKGKMIYKESYNRDKRIYKFSAAYKKLELHILENYKYIKFDLYPEKESHIKENKLATYKLNKNV